MKSGEDEKIANFGEAFKRLEKYREEKPVPVKEESFATMLRNSKYVKLGDPEKKILIGKVYLVLQDDVYVDFGGKFPAVCK